MLVTNVRLKDYCILSEHAASEVLCFVLSIFYFVNVISHAVHVIVYAKLLCIIFLSVLFSLHGLEERSFK